MKYVSACLALAALVAPAHAMQAPPLLHVAYLSGPYKPDLIQTGRRLAFEQGMLSARNSLEAAVLLQDSSAGGFEADLIRAAQDSSYLVPGAIEALPLAASPDGVTRSDVRFLFINGLGQTPRSICSVLLADAVSYLRSKGFGAEILATGPYASTAQNGTLLLDQLRDRLRDPAAQHVIIIGVSKGVHDFVEALIQNEESASPVLGREELDRIKIVVSLAGIVRNSAVAEWLVRSKSLVARALRLFMRPPFGKFPNMDAVESLTRDPWERLSANGRRMPGNFGWISFAVFPDGAKGQPRAGYVRGRLLHLLRGSKPVGPYDGLTESAASLLPPDAGLEQWIVRIRGSHGLIKGTYLDGTPVARNKKKAAQQIIDSLLRSIPASALDRQRQPFPEPMQAARELPPEDRPQLAP